MFVKAPQLTRSVTWLRRLSLIELISLIVNDESASALAELHNNRPVFKVGNSRPLLMAEYLDVLRKQLSKRKWPGRNYQEIAEHAYDLVVDRFSNLQSREAGGADCRKYFGAFLQAIGESFQENPLTDQLEAEAWAAAILQNLVTYNFKLCQLEAERCSNPFWSRYDWALPGGIIRLWMPKTIQGRARGKWLETNDSQPDPNRPGERERIQDLINRHFVRETLVTLEDCPSIAHPSSAPPFAEALLKESLEEASPWPSRWLMKKPETSLSNDHR